MAETRQMEDQEPVEKASGTGADGQHDRRHGADGKRKDLGPARMGRPGGNDQKNRTDWAPRRDHGGPRPDRRSNEQDHRGRGKPNAYKAYKAYDQERPEHDRRPYGQGRPEGGKPQNDHRPYGQDRPEDRRPQDEHRPYPAGSRSDGRAHRAVPAQGGYQAYEHHGHRQVEGLASRRVALNVIRAVTENGSWASTVLDRELQGAGLNPKDRRLAARLAYDVLDRMYYLDAVLDQVMAKPDTDIRLRNILRLGACQLLLEDHIPDMAATDTAVELCREIGLDGLAGVCNGILRNLIRHREELTLDAIMEARGETDPVNRLSIELSAPEFLVLQLQKDYGLEGARQILSATGRDSKLTVRPNLMKIRPENFEALLMKKVWDVRKGELPHSWYVENAANIGRDSDFLSGHFSIQSEQSQMACLAAMPKRGAMVLDACAAPGGKSCYLAELMDGTGRVQAWEVREHRTQLIEAQVKRLGLDNVRPMTRDASAVREDLAQSMDVVLLDAPCTGTGEMHDKPDSKYRMKPDSLSELVETQRKLLDAVASYVRPGGTLVYSTCSVLKDENVRQIQDFLNRHPEFEIAPLPDTIPQRVRAAYDVGVQLLPGVNASGGFYICRMRRKRI